LPRWERVEALVPLGVRLSGPAERWAGRVESHPGRSLADIVHDAACVGVLALRAEQIGLKVGIVNGNKFEDRTALLREQPLLMSGRTIGTVIPKGVDELMGDAQLYAAHCGHGDITPAHIVHDGMRLLSLPGRLVVADPKEIPRIGWQANVQNIYEITTGGDYTNVPPLLYAA
jgi:hypothetical protein